MAIYRNKGRFTWRERLFLRGQRRDVTLETRHEAQALRRSAMLRSLEASVAGEEVLDRWLQRRCTLADIAAALKDGAPGLLGLVRRADQPDLTLGSLAAAYLKARTHDLSPGSLDNYRTLLGQIAQRFPSTTRLTRTAFFDWVQTQPWGKGRKRQAACLLRDVCSWAVETRRLAENPLAGKVETKDFPEPGPRDQWLDLPDIGRLLAAAEGDAILQCALALAYGAGMERQTICRVTPTDVQAPRMIRAQGTKTRTRDRVARVEPWAWPYVQRRLAVCGPAERLVPWGVDDLSKRHVHLCRTVDLPGYHLHDARRSWAIRMVKAGVPIEAVSNQLGHANAAMVLSTYGRFRPTAHDWSAWEGRAGEEHFRESLGAQRLQVSR